MKEEAIIASVENAKISLLRVSLVIGYISIVSRYFAFYPNKSMNTRHTVVYDSTSSPIHNLLP